MPGDGDEVAVLLPGKAEDRLAWITMGHVQLYLGRRQCLRPGPEALEKLLRPRWPFVLGGIEVARAYQGSSLFRQRFAEGGVVQEIEPVAEAPCELGRR